MLSYDDHKCISSAHSIRLRLGRRPEPGVFGPSPYHYLVYGNIQYTKDIMSIWYINPMKRPSRTGNQKKLGIIVAGFFGFILLTSTVLIAVPSILPDGSQMAGELTGTPADNFSGQDRLRFCGVGQPQSNAYITEYRVPTPCAQPLAVEVTPDGRVWFAQANTGNLAVFDNITQEITEFDNPFWDDSVTSMIWGMDYDSGYLWYTDATGNSVWRFDIAAESYRQFQLPNNNDPFPQRLEVVGTDIILNDLTGNLLVMMDISDLDGAGPSFNTVPSDVEGAITAGFAMDRDETIWYTTWVEQGGGILVNVDPDLIKRLAPSDPIIEQLPPGLRTPNGITVDGAGTVWLADTSSSYFFSYDRDTGNYTHYVTSHPDVLTYGNITGMVQMPISRPYWMATADDGRIIFNEQTGNRIGVMDPRTEKLVEYSIPSRNPFWSDCGTLVICGISQALDFTVSGDRVWFTEWVENNIGVLDISKDLQLDILVDTPRVVLRPGESTTVSYTILPETDRPLAVTPVNSYSHTFLYVVPHVPPQVDILEEASVVFIDIITEDNAIPGEYKILVGAEAGPVVVSQFITVEIIH